MKLKSGATGYVSKLKEDIMCPGVLLRNVLITYY